MITEDYVSFEVAKLLKEKGFDEKCRYIWMFDKANDPQDTDGISKVCAEQLIDGSFIDNSGINKAAEDGNWFEDYHKVYLCPTLQMAMKWLREVHNLHIVTLPYAPMDRAPHHPGEADMVYIIQLFKGIIPIDEIGRSIIKLTYEEACEEAIKYCLTHLI